MFVESGCEGKLFLASGEQVDVSRETKRSFSILLTKPDMKTAQP